jgi:2',3'-cyclic-nucleotide 2'-phosphodiesterase (5'-nucleotidase family)
MPRIKLVVFVMLATTALVFFGCNSPTPNLSTSPLPVPTNTPMLAPTDTPASPPTNTPTPVPTTAPKPLELTVLHTNDTMGYTEPCG